jgi:hypothetical protein
MPCDPKIAFSAFNPIVISELGGEDAGCDAQSTVTLGLFSFMASETIHFTTSGNAEAGVDFDLDVSSLTFDGDEIKQLTITIYNDKVVEEPDTLIISFDDGGYSDADTLIILDDDVFAIVRGTHTLLSEEFSGDEIPVAWSQALINPESAAHWEFNGVGTEAGRAYAAIPGSPIAVYDQLADARVRLISPLIDARGKKNVEISFDWEAGGETDAADSTLLFDYGTFQISPDGKSWTNIQDFVGSGSGAIRKTGSYLAIHPELNDQVFYLGFRWYNDALVGTSFSFAIDNVVVSANGLDVASSIGASMETVVPVQTEIGFVQASELSIVAIIDHAIGNLGCTTVSIDENDLENDFLPTALCDQRGTKVIEVSTENTTDTFELTLYFDGSAVSAWDNPELLNILAVQDGNIENENLGVSIISNSGISINNQLGGFDDYISYTFSTTGLYKTYTLTDRSDVPINRMVMNLLDSGALSLRERLDAACPADTIRFDASLAGDTVRLSGSELLLDKSVVMMGLGMDLITISGELNSRVMRIMPDAAVHLYDLELIRGSANTMGGAVFSQGDLRLTRVRMRENLVNGSPQAIFNQGSLHMVGSVILDQ